MTSGFGYYFPTSWKKVADNALNITSSCRLAPPELVLFARIIQTVHVLKNEPIEFDVSLGGGQLVRTFFEFYATVFDPTMFITLGVIDVGMTVAKIAYHALNNWTILL